MVGLKFQYKEKLESVKHRLKSDYGRIEIWDDYSQHRSKISLKSDYGRIEIKKQKSGRGLPTPC